MAWKSLPWPLLARSEVVPTAGWRAIIWIVTGPWAQEIWKQILEVVSTVPQSIVAANQKCKLSGPSPWVMECLSSFAGRVSLCSQHWCPCNILHRLVKVSMHICCLAHFSRSIVTSLHWCTYLTLAFARTSCVLKAWTKAGLLSVAFLSGKKIPSKGRLCWFYCYGRERHLGTKHYCWIFVCNELVPDEVFVLKMLRS